MDVKKVAELARLKITEKEAELYQKQFSSILDYFSQLECVNTEGVEPLITPTEVPVFWREDKSEKWENVDEALSAAPETLGQLFKVPPVV